MKYSNNRYSARTIEYDYDGQRRQHFFGLSNVLIRLRSIGFFVHASIELRVHENFTQNNFKLHSMWFCAYATHRLFV